MQSVAKHLCCYVVTNLFISGRCRRKEILKNNWVKQSLRTKVQLLKKKDIANLERFQRHCLKLFQGLPDNTSNSVSLALLGILPIEALLHKNLLNIFVNMIRHDNSIKFEFA